MLIDINGLKVVPDTDKGYGNMKNIYAVICLILGLMFLGSCQTSDIVTNMTEEMELSRTMTSDIQSVVESVRQGNADAYKELAYAYRDGEGVEQSNINAMFMYLMYCTKTGLPEETIVELYDKDSPTRLLWEILIAADMNQNTEEKISRLQQLSPADAKVLTSLSNSMMSKNKDNFLGILQEAESEGSELAIIIQAIHYEETKQIETYVQFLNKAVKKYPFLYIKLAKIYEDRYEKDNDFMNIQKALEYYYEADAYGMLNNSSANRICRIYEKFCQKGLIEKDEKEIGRLKKIVEKETN